MPIPTYTMPRPAEKPIEPIPEYVHPGNNPYRGMETHGVAENVEPEGTSPEWATRPALDHGPAPKPADPIRVADVNKTKKPKRASYYNATINDRAVRFDGNAHRESVLIKCIIGPLIISNHNTVDTTDVNSFPLVTGDNITIDHTEEFFVGGPAGSQFGSITQYWE